jgi:hypothetical protein
MKHLLSLEIPDTLDTCAMMVRDMSVYSDLLPYECATLQVTAPGWITASKFEDLDKNFTLVMTACTMGSQTVDCDNPMKLVDGMYVVKWSISPNATVYVEYNHLRITSALRAIQSILCCLDLRTCLPEPKILFTLRELSEWEMMLKAAKATVEVCHKPSKGMEMYTFALKNLHRIAQVCGCSDVC